MSLVLIAAGLAVILYGGHRLALFAESKGWIFYTIRAPRVRMLGLLEELVDPRVEYWVEEQGSETIRADYEESGETSANHDVSEATADPWRVTG